LVKSKKFIYLIISCTRLGLVQSKKVKFPYLSHLWDPQKNYWRLNRTPFLSKENAICTNEELGVNVICTNTKLNGIRK
jgi:hypothetical protein